MSAIREKLAELRAADPGLRVFGASRHRYELNPPVDEAFLTRFETEVGVPLPEEYRTFLTTVGDGGAGPYWGLLSLAESVAAVAGTHGVAVLGKDSPLTADVDFGELLGQPDDWDEHAARLDDDQAYADSWDALQAEYLDEPWPNGRIPICDHGCGDRFHLVLRGPRRGTVWVDSLDSATGLYCLEVDFSTWYETWLDAALPRTRTGEFGPRNAHYSYLEYGRNPRYRPV